MLNHWKRIYNTPACNKIWRWKESKHPSRVKPKVWTWNFRGRGVCSNLIDIESCGWELEEGSVLSLLLFSSLHFFFSFFSSLSYYLLSCSLLSSGSFSLSHIISSSAFFYIYYRLHFPHLSSPLLCYRHKDLPKGFGSLRRGQQVKSTKMQTVVVVI